MERDFWLELILILVVTYIAPYPIWLTLLHIAARKKVRFTLLFLLYLSIGVAWLILFYFCFTHKEALFSGRFEPGLFLQALGFLLLIGSLLIEWQSTKVMGIRRITCLLEIQQKGGAGGLVTEGIYKYARHPRYLEYPSVPLGLGLIFGYSFLILFSIYLFAGYTVVSYFEDAELLQRFGLAYEEYQRRVPRFFIRLPFGRG